MRPFGPFAVALAGSLYLVPAGKAAPPPGAPVDAILARLREVRGLKATFREEKHLALLARPLVSSGEVFLVSPGRIARKVTAPARAMLVVDGQSVRVLERGTERSIPPAAQPMVTAVVGGLLALLTGDASAIRSSFSIESAKQEGDAWAVVLVPRAAPLSNAIKRLEVHGTGASVRELHVVEATGDTADTTFTNVDVQSAVREEDWRAFVAAGATR